MSFEELTADQARTLDGLRFIECREYLAQVQGDDSRSWSAFVADYEEGIESALIPCDLAIDDDGVQDVYKDWIQLENAVDWYFASPESVYMPVFRCSAYPSGWRWFTPYTDGEFVDSGAPDFITEDLSGFLVAIKRLK